MSVVFASLVGSKGKGMVTGEHIILASKALCRRACFFVNYLYTPATVVYAQPDAGVQQAPLMTTWLTHGDRSPKTKRHKSVNL